jgi:nitroreductase
MELMDSIEMRKSYRAFDPVEITDEMISELMYSASRAPSCNNNQPWRFIFVREEKILDKVKDTLTRGNYWGKRASAIIALVSRPDLDCQTDGRNYNLLDSGMAMGFMLLKATEMGLASHPIAGFDQKAVKEILNIPNDYELLPLIIIGERSDDLDLLEKDRHKESEVKRSKRKPMEEVMSIDGFRFGEHG